VDVMKVAAYCKVTEEMIADQDGIRSYLDNRLAYMVQAKEDYLLLYGLAASYEPTGVLQTSGIQTVAAGGYPTVMDAIGQAVGKVRGTGYAEPDGIVVNSNDWTDLILSKDSNGQFYAGGPFMNQYGAGQFSNVFRMFGIPVIVTSFITEGTALVGAFRMSSQLFRREGVRVEATNTHDTDFVYNLITIRAEARMCLAVYKPLGFCSVTGIA
jgi:HK97 family phage major capsid protein